MEHAAELGRRQGFCCCRGGKEEPPLAAIDERRLGPHFVRGDRWRFCVWAPFAATVDLRILGAEEHHVPMHGDDAGYFTVEVAGLHPGMRYLYRLNGGEERPDPASRLQPHGVHGPSEIVDPSFDWSDGGWTGLKLDDYILYELHAGTFSAEGTFEGIIPHLEGLWNLGVTAVELMPVAQFPGRRNWGYDGVGLFAVQGSYGGPAGLKRLVDACHRRQMALVLDVVYNHLGPEGNYLSRFGPYFTERYRTPWGAAINFDGPDSDEVRRFFVENALYWIEEFHVDALRLDAVHSIHDQSAVPFLQELGEAVHDSAGRLGRKIYVIPESSLNDTRIIRPQEQGGFALDAQWNDDFHHSLRTLITRDLTGYYQDFGRLEHLAKAYREGYVYSGQYSAFRRRRHGNNSKALPANKFVVFSQNHDQAGNRMRGERLTRLVGFEALKLAAGAVILSPFIPLLFMGEEYGETAPFLYFVSHGDPGLIEAVREGRKREFASLNWMGVPPDPQDEGTFTHSRLNHALAGEGRHRLLRNWYAELLRWRKGHPALAFLSKEQMEVSVDEEGMILVVRRWRGNHEVALCLHLESRERRVVLPLPPGSWHKVLDSGEERWLGPGSSTPQRLSPAQRCDERMGPFQLVLLSRNGPGAGPATAGQGLP